MFILFVGKLPFIGCTNITNITKILIVFIEENSNRSSLHDPLASHHGALSIHGHSLDNYPIQKNA